MKKIIVFTLTSFIILSAYATEEEQKNTSLNNTHPLSLRRKIQDDEDFYYWKLEQSEKIVSDLENYAKLIKLHNIPKEDVNSKYEIIFNDIKKLVLSIVTSKYYVDNNDLNVLAEDLSIVSNQILEVINLNK